METELGVTKDYIENLVYKKNKGLDKFRPVIIKKFIDFDQLDMTVVKSDTFNKKFDYIISKRAVQNVLLK